MGCKGGLLDCFVFLLHNWYQPYCKFALLQVVCARAYTFEQQFDLLPHLAAKMSEEPYKLLIMDSITANMRCGGVVGEGSVHLQLDLHGDATFPEHGEEQGRPLHIVRLQDGVCGPRRAGGTAAEAGAAHGAAAQGE